MPPASLLLASAEAAGSAERYPLDNVRMQKAVFLLTQRGPEGWRSSYGFEPYNWGPFSRLLAAELRDKTEAGELATFDAPGSRHAGYRATAVGEAEISAAWHGLTDREKNFVRTVRRYVTSKSFNDLLREVYAEYPDYATRSQFSG